MTKITVESGIPMPTANKNNKGKEKYPWSSMNVGDSFLFPEDGGANIQGKASNGAAAAGRRLGRKFATRKVDGGIRIWRTS